MIIKENASVRMYEYKSRVIKVVDGDTIDVDIDLGFDIILSNQRIRLAGIDTPESRTRDLEEKKFGLLAKEMVESYCPIGSTVTLRTSKDERGKFGRILGDFIIYDSVSDSWGSLCKYLVDKHYAVAYEGQSKDEIKEAHFFNREKLRGLLSE
ncbi:MAG: nuclease [Flavobacteriales bacterium]|nr:nuclease [Flavobacteriales bacterium]